jgi:hypothetical protein
LEDEILHVDVFQIHTLEWVFQVAVGGGASSVVGIAGGLESGDMAPFMTGITIILKDIAPRGKLSIFLTLLMI